MQGASIGSCELRKLACASLQSHNKATAFTDATPSVLGHVFLFYEHKVVTKDPQLASNAVVIRVINPDDGSERNQALLFELPKHRTNISLSSERRNRAQGVKQLGDSLIHLRQRMSVDRCEYARQQHEHP